MSIITSQLLVKEFRVTSYSRLQVTSNELNIASKAVIDDWSKLYLVLSTRSLVQG